MSARKQRWRFTVALPSGRKLLATVVAASPEAARFVLETNGARPEDITWIREDGQ